MATPPNLPQLKEGMRATWMAGDFGKIAEYTAEEAESYVDTLGITKGMRVLDVACGTGNLAIPAARKGADVTGVDIASNLLRQARHRATEENLSINFEEGDAEDLPFGEAEFDLVMSMFGAMFAPRPDRVASELARVCRHGGRIAMANWTPQGFTGKMFRLGSEYAPPPPGLAPPVLWGDDATVRARFAAVGVEVETKRRIMLFEYPLPPADVVKFFAEYFGPTRMALARMDPAAQTAHNQALEKLWVENNQSDSGKTLIQNEYLEVIGKRT
jgi:SAM-dependent methyltransferase